MNWKNINTGNEFDEHYMISDSGKVKRLGRQVHNYFLPEKELTIFYNNTNQPYFKLRWERKQHTIYIKTQLKKIFNL